VNAHVLFFLHDLEAHDIALLLLVDVLSEDISTLGVGLTPLLRVSVEELKTKDTLAELAHDRSPQHGINLVSFPAEKRVYFWKLAQVETASVGAALLVRGREGTELAVPGFTGLIA